MAKISRRKTYYSRKDGRKPAERHILRWSDETGTRRNKSFQRRADAESYRITIEQEKMQGLHIPDSVSPTVTEAGQRWIELLDQRVVAGHISRNTRRSYESRFRLHIEPFLGHIKLSRLKGPTIQDWADKLAYHPDDPRSVKAIEHCTIVLKSMLTDCQRLGMVATNVVKLAPPKLGKSRSNPVTTQRIPSREQLKQILNTDLPMRSSNGIPRWIRSNGKVDAAYFNRRLQLMIRLALFCGLRMGEVLGLHWINVDFQNDLILVRHQADQIDGRIGPPKSNSAIRDIPMPPELATDLKKWRLSSGTGNQNLVFCEDTGTAHKPVVINHPLRALFEELRYRNRNARGMWNIDTRYTFHDFRHACVSLWKAQGVDILEISRMIGHKNPSTTLNIYAHLFADAETGKLASSEIEQQLLG